ncbi:OmpA/MotB family protein [Clostridium minihomine]|uniref:OmpA/MotB family protein n=1 Tax=Clostridium minihomine TaxID=2045012 RepID=UPI000C7834B2|nr:flagellar motor protein MotB [Clostridium minihomine]
MARRRKKGGEAEAPENHERWLLTYSDMITLLLALFMILYSMSTIDAKKFAKMAEQAGYQMGTATSDGTGGGGGGTGTGTGTGTGAGAGTGTASGVGTGNVETTMDALDEVYSILQTYVEKNHLEDQIGLVNTNTYVKIHLKDKLMFVPDSSRMLPESEPILKEVAEAISTVYDRVDQVTFSGHTADVGPHTLSGDQFSWRLSTERAVTVLTKMIGYGMPQDKVSIEGYAHFSPVANNNVEEGRAKNRRVEITILKNPPVLPDGISQAPSEAAESSQESSAAAH